MKLNLFHWEQRGRTVVVRPDFDGRAFRYQDLQLEANAIRTQMMNPGRQNLIVDLSRMDYFGSEFVGAVICMLRETQSRGGKACFCCAPAQALDVLRSTGLFRVWPHFETLEAALEASDGPDTV